ncbi:MAG: amylo-alpha-1,6-glucosidase [bacterium]
MKLTSNKLENSQGLSVQILDNGAVYAIDAGQVRVGMSPATWFSRQGANIFLRKRGKSISFIPLTGPGSPSRYGFGHDLFMAEGQWSGIEYVCALQLSQSSQSWQWRVELKNISKETLDLDAVCVQDAGLKRFADGPVNEYYISQYTERRILEDNHYGTVACCRQNMKEAGGNPWLMMACRNGAKSGSTDGIRFYGRSFRETGIPEALEDEHFYGECAGESSVLALQEIPFRIAPGDSHISVFVATCLLDHPEATSDKDLERLPDLFAEFLETTPSFTAKPTGPSTNLFSKASFLPVDDLDEMELDSLFGKGRSHPETSEGKLLSFFTKTGNHVILRAKEILVDRPHGHIMQANAGLLPDESVMSTTAFAFGVFNSHLTQGNTNFNTLLSVCTSQFNLSLERGQRILVEMNDRLYLLGVPSAFEMGLNHCRWIYKHGSRVIEVRSWTMPSTPQVNMDIRIAGDPPVRLIITHDFDELNGWKVQPGNNPGEFIALPKTGSMIAGKFPGAQFRMVIHPGSTKWRAHDDAFLFTDNESREYPIFVLEAEEVRTFCMSFIGEVTGPVEMIPIADAGERWLSDRAEKQAHWKSFSMNLDIQSDNGDMSAIREILPWYGMNALIHYLTPYGLEQFSGAAWGTRDVSQGPVDLLLSTGNYTAARQVLLTIFSNQDTDGGWPQWWMFDSYHEVRAADSHGDVFYWCIIALSQYIRITGDTDILQESLPYYHPEGVEFSETTPLSEHLDRLVQMIIGSFIPGTALVPFGGGDWNDSLQPLSKDLAARMISSWTVEMNYQAFTELREVYEMMGWKDKAKTLHEITGSIKSDFNRHLVRDRIVAGYGLVAGDGSISVMLHPRDERTGIHYSLLPMERGIISGIFNGEQARYHYELIEKHLKGPDGARLMDRPLKYNGGIMSIFQRAESSTFFGREIGLMYMHEHIRYAELLAELGKAGEFVKALRQAIPVDYKDAVPVGDFRQSNCYYSSSDVSFKNRYEADERYGEVLTGRFPLKGGWRVYSSGPGIFVAMVITRLLGIRMEANRLILDPVMPRAFNGLTVSLNLLGYPVSFNYIVTGRGYGPTSIMVNGKPVPFEREHNPYREGGSVIVKAIFLQMLKKGNNVVEVRS